MGSFCRTALLSIFAVTISAPAHGAEPAPGLIVPPGLVAEKFAGDDLAHDIYTIVTDGRGDPIVAGPGYIKRLLDENGDGTADRAITLSEFPKNGAHGLCLHPDGLLVNGDDKLSLLRDKDGNGAYETRDVWATLKNTEHGANNIVRGPDGWYYVACGNDAGVTAAFAKTEASPIKTPIAGAILRFSPDGTNSEIVADGFRNPYGLAFASDGVLWTYDSDNERDQFLPWYCPTRLFAVRSVRITAGSTVVGKAAGTSPSVGPTRSNDIVSWAAGLRPAWSATQARGGRSSIVTKFSPRAGRADGSTPSIAPRRRFRIRAHRYATKNCSSVPHRAPHWRSSAWRSARTKNCSSR
ncbi:MAG: hypothetical protein QM811_20005 [Pirellulales bacterium]